MTSYQYTLPDDAEAPEFATKKDFALARIRELIRRGDYLPGARLRQAAVASDLGLSLTPVREALGELQTQGLVESVQHRGYRVVDPDPGRLAELYAARRVVESAAARAAARRLGGRRLDRLAELLEAMTAAEAAGDRGAMAAADEAFHHTLYAAGGNRYLLDSIAALWDAFPRHALWSIAGRPRVSLREHAAILDAARAGKPKKLARAIAAHLDDALAALLADKGMDQGDRS